jgi:hypothetical protein
VVRGALFACLAEAATEVSAWRRWVLLLHLDSPTIMDAEGNFFCTEW